MNKIYIAPNIKVKELDGEDLMVVQSNQSLTEESMTTNGDTGIGLSTVQQYSASGQNLDANGNVVEAEAKGFSVWGDDEE